MDKDEEILQIDSAYLSGLVRAAYQNPQLVIPDWHVQRLHGGFQLNSTIYRLQGNALEDGNPRPWSLVVKIVRPDRNHDTSSDYRYWKREVLAYQSGTLDNLPGPLLAPRCYDIISQADGSHWLFLEDLRSDSKAAWTLEQYSHTARCLGKFNGDYLAGCPLPAGAWIASGWLRNYLDHAAPAVNFIRTHPRHPLVQSIFPGNTLAQLLAFWDISPFLLRKLDNIPHTFCHQDAFDRNLFLRNGEVVAIDWGYTGIAPVGSELAPLIAAAIGIDGFPSTRARELDAACFNAYLKGLSQAGYKPNARQVRLGFTLTISLRYLVGNVVGETIPSLLDQERRERIIENVPTADIEHVKSDPGNVVYFQGIILELFKQLGPVFTLGVFRRTLSYMIRLSVS